MTPGPHLVAWSGGERVANPAPGFPAETQERPMAPYRFVRFWRHPR
jgi:hypothetical protein